MISPLLANVFLHYVLDEWFAEQVQPRLRGPSTLVRYADDFVMLFAYKDDAERVLEVLGKRLGKYGLQLHPDKTRMVDFRYREPAPHDGGADDGHDLRLPRVYPRMGTLAEGQSGGATADGERSLGACDQCDSISSAASCDIGPCGSSTNVCVRCSGGTLPTLASPATSRASRSLYDQAKRCWRKWLSRRSNNSPVSWAAFQRVLQYLPLPRPRIVHRYAGS